jgi:hypothetical protein
MGSGSRPPIGHLHSARCPSAVAGLVIAVVVDSVQGGPWRTLPHIFVEGQEGLVPSLAYFDSTPAVILVCAMVWIAASIAHRFPCFVRPRVDHAVPIVQCRANVFNVAPATECMAGIEATSELYGSIPAVAERDVAGEPSPFGAHMVGGSLNHNKSSEPLSDVILLRLSRHERIITDA